MTRSKGKAKFHIMLTLVVILWGLEYAVAKDALDHVDTVVIMNMKYFFGIFVIAAFAAKTGNLQLPKRKDIPMLIAITILGHLVYFYCEYTALKLIPVANLTIILGFLPMGSVLVEKLVFGRLLSRKLLVFMLISVFGIFLTIGTDLASLGGGKALGYLVCVIALFAWIGFLFTTEAFAGKYGPVQISLYQAVLAWILTIPLTIPHVPEIVHLSPKIYLELIYLGVVSEGLCFLAEVACINRLGPTICAVYSNFLPVTSALFGVLLLGQDLVMLQYIGGALVILFGYFIIREKDRLSSLPVHTE